jgi:hypothetical protein
MLERGPEMNMKDEILDGFFWMVVPCILFEIRVIYQLDAIFVYFSSYMKDEAGLRLAVHWLQQALITAYEDNCPPRFVKTGRKSLRWTARLESLRREMRRLFNRCRADNKPSSWELSREAQ